MTVIDTPDGIAFFRMCSRRSALKLEILGMVRSGDQQTAYSICKSEYGLKGNKKKVLAQMETMITEIKKAREAQACNQSQ